MNFKNTESQSIMLVSAPFELNINTMDNILGETLEFTYYENALQALNDEEEETKRFMGDSVKLLLQAAKRTAAEYANLPGIGKWERRNENEK